MRPCSGWGGRQPVGVCGSSGHCLGPANQEDSEWDTLNTPPQGWSWAVHSTLCKLSPDTRCSYSGSPTAPNVQGKLRKASLRNYSKFWRDIWLHAKNPGKIKKKVAQTRHSHINLAGILMACWYNNNGSRWPVQKSKPSSCALIDGKIQGREQRFCSDGG